MLPQTTPTNPTPIPANDAQSAQRPIQRIMVVRSEDLRERIGAALEGAELDIALDTAPSYLSAMGRLIVVKPDVIIGPVSALAGMVASTARALRKLCPTAQLIIVAQPDEHDEAQAAIYAGFDHCIDEPAEAMDLLAAIGVAPQTAAPPVASAQRDEAQSQHAPPNVGNTTYDSAVPSAERTHALATPPLPASETVELGDVDLVESVLQDEGHLPQQAQRLLAQQSGIPGVALALSADQVPPGNAAVAVHCNGQQLGLLHAPPPATPRELEPWADWIARWLALGKHVADLRKQAMTDELTGIYNRRYFQQFLQQRIDQASRERQQVTLLLFDIDDFKQYNDTYGHPAGDDILKETARLIQSLVRDHDVVARIGGDEFAVVFWDKGEPRHLGSQHPDSVIGIARRFQKAIAEHKFPKLGTQAQGTLTVSGGLAGFPWDGRTCEELIAQADAMAIQSKRKGKNAVCFGPGCAPYSNGNDSTTGATDDLAIETPDGSGG